MPVDCKRHGADRDDGPASHGSGNPWSLMTAVFKYIITEALFTNNAKLGSFVFNEDWMISTQGSPSGKTYYDFDPKGFMNYITSGTSYSGFIPNFAVDGKTGKTYQNDAYVKGTINATSGVISGNVDIGTTGNKMQIYADEYRTSGYYSGIKGISNNNNVFDLGFNTQNGYTNMFMGMLGTMPFAGHEMRCTVRPHEIVFQDHTGGTWAQIGYFYDTQSGKMSFRLFAPPSIWPSRDQVTIGEVFVGDDEILRVRLS